MNKKFSLLAMAALMTAGPATQASEGLISGATVDLGIGYAMQYCKESSNPAFCSADDGHYVVFEGEGNFQFVVNPTTSVQLDLASAIGDVRDSSSDKSEEGFEDFYMFALHLTYRQTDSYAFGAFAGGLQADGSDDTADAKTRTTFFGVEGQKYLDNMTLYGQLGYFDTTADIPEEDHDSIDNATFLRGELRYFLDDTSMLTGNVGYVYGQEGEKGDIFSDETDEMQEGWSWGIRYKRAMADHPLNWYVSYKGLRIEDNDDDDRVTENTVMIGLEMPFGGHGGQSMKTIDRRGATMSAPTEIGRWTAWTQDVAE